MLARHNTFRYLLVIACLLTSTLLAEIARVVDRSCLENVNETYTDVESLTVMSVVVFEGQLVGKQADTASSDVDLEFVIGEVFKGSESLTSLTDVVVRVPSECALSLSLNKRYFVFLNQSRMDDDYGSLSQWTSTAVTVRYTRRGARRVREHSCSNCGRGPRSARLTPEALYGRYGHPIDLHCRSSRHTKPSARVTWYKDGVIVVESERLQVESTRRGSRLVIKEAELDDAGKYTCHVSNVIGSAVSAISHVTVARPALTTKPHSRLCDVQYYCLNMGTCYVLVPLNHTYCECQSPYTGKRCERVRFDESMYSANISNPLAFGGLLIGVIVLVLLICIAYFVIKHYVAFKKYQVRSQQSRPVVSTHANGSVKGQYGPVSRQYTRSTETDFKVDDSLPHVVVTTPPSSASSFDVQSRACLIPPSTVDTNSSPNSTRSLSPRRARLSAVSFAPTPVVSHDEHDSAEMERPAIHGTVDEIRTTSKRDEDRRKRVNDEEQEQMRALLRDLGVNSNSGI